jgi:arsenite-transporting ATPase
VDPQASLSDIFQKDIFGKGPVPIMKNLWAQEVDADRRIKDYQAEIRKKILDMYGFEKVPEEIDNYIAAASAEPAMEETDRAAWCRRRSARDHKDRPRDRGARP